LRVENRGQVTTFQLFSQHLDFGQDDVSHLLLGAKRSRDSTARRHKNRARGHSLNPRTTFLMLYDEIFRD
jgi:hypothetical protein